MDYVWSIPHRSSTICTWNVKHINISRHSTAKAVVGVPQSGEEIFMNDGCGALGWRARWKIGVKMVWWEKQGVKGGWESSCWWTCKTTWSSSWQKRKAFFLIFRGCEGGPLPARWLSYPVLKESTTLCKKYFPFHTKWSYDPFLNGLTKTYRVFFFLLVNFFCKHSWCIGGSPVVPRSWG